MMSLTENTEIKSIEGWGVFADEHKGECTDWDAYCKPGDLVGEDVYDYFLDILPPRTFNKNMLQVGEPHSSMKNPDTSKFQSTYATFIRFGKLESGGNVYRYFGNCFAGELVDMSIYRKYDTVNDWLKATRSRTILRPSDYIRPCLICKDGFRMSVQASESHNSNPRENVDSCEYSYCEVGAISEKEELLLPYIEGEFEETLENIYPFVPTSVIEQVISKHGGYFIAGMPVV